MTSRKMKIGYQNRQSKGYGGSGVGWSSRDLAPSPYIRIANRFLKDIAGFDIGQQIMVDYSFGEIVIKPAKI